MTVESYVSLLNSAEGNFETSFHLAYNGKEAYELIMSLQTQQILPDVAFLDVNLPPYQDKNITSGIDLAMLLRSIFPACKLVIITMHKEPVWVNRIFKSINPEGFISKTEINFRTFPQAYEQILRGEFYYSESISESQRFFIRKNINWDEHDSKILLLLSEGKKTINLPDYMSLSLSSIEKRKANLKKQLIFDGGSDEDLISVAKKLGLL
jgi:DNA-binding NarL/FixJ family response regulator